MAGLASLVAFCVAACLLALAAAPVDSSSFWVPVRFTAPVTCSAVFWSMVLIWFFTSTFKD